MRRSGYLPGLLEPHLADDNTATTHFGGVTCRPALLFLRTMNEPSPGIEDCPFCGTAVRPGAIVCAACGAFKDKRMGCTGCLALLGAVVFAFGTLAMVALLLGAEHPGAKGFAIFAGLVYAGGTAFCYWALSRKRQLKWYRRM